MKLSNNRILKEIRNWEKESMTGEHPMVFVSYSYDNDEHCSWVGALRDKLRADGVNAIIDQSLPNGYPLNLFMEQILKSSLLKFVVCVCSTEYAQKADSGVGGVGYEQAIMTRELTNSFGSNKIIPILRNNPNGYVPTFLGTRKYLDFRNDKDFDDAFFELTGDIFEIPRMPPVGPVPDWVQKRLAATTVQNELREEKGGCQEDSEREKIAKFIERTPKNVLDVLVRAKNSDGGIIMVNAPYMSLPRDLIVGNTEINDGSGELVLSYLINKGFVNRVHKDWKTEVYFLTNGAHDLLDKAKEFKLL